MYDVEILLKLEYSTLKQYILNEESFMLEALKDYRIKEKLINCKNKYDLIWLSQDMSDEYASVLFDEQGIEILSKTKEIEDKMNGIMTCGKDYVSELLKSEVFCSIIQKHFANLSSYLSSLDKEGALAFIKYIKENDPDKLKNTLFSLSSNVQELIVKEIEIPSDILSSCLVCFSKKASEYIMNNDLRITSLNDYNFDQLYTIFSKGYPIHTAILEESKLFKKIISMKSVKDYRFLINELSKGNDIKYIEKMRKDYYKLELMTYDKEFKMLGNYKNCYLDFCDVIDMNQLNSDLFYEKVNKYFNLFGSGNERWEIEKKLWQYTNKKDKEGLRKFLINESNIQMSNMIIDYHFEDVPYNFFLDINQLCNFQKSEGRTLSDEDLIIYQRLLNIDSLSYEEKIKLHQELQQEDWISKHYDVFREAKNKASQLIKEQMLNENNIKQYFDKELSENHGVPIYTLDGQDYFALVKSLSRDKEFPLEKTDIYYYVDGSSFSLDGSKKLMTFKNPKTNYNLIYSDFSVDQVIHMYPVDSFSKYDRTYSINATPRVYELYTPTEFIEKSSDYNEIIIAQHNKRRVDDELNNHLKNPTILGIYCYDEITPNDIESAKKLGIGIVVVKTKSYTINKDNRLSMNETLTPFKYQNDINYLDNVNEDDMYKRRAK